MKKILFIIQSYPSEKSANVFCDEMIIKQLLSSGNYEIHCLCNRYNGQSETEIIDGVKVHRLSRGVFWEIFTWAMRHESEKMAKIIYSIQRIFLRIKQMCTIPFYPVVEPFVCRKFSYAAEALHQQYHFDIVFAEYFGPETLLAGCALKKHHGTIQFVPVFWDALSGGLNPRYLPEKYAVSQRLRLEKSVLEIADIPIVMTAHQERLKQAWEGTSFFKKIKFLDIPRFQATVENDRYECEFDKNNVNIVFAGNMGVRDPAYVFELLGRCSDNNITVWFFTSRKYEDRIKSLAKKYNVNVVMKGFVEKEVLKGYLSNADVYLNLGVDTDCLIPSKIFEYMSYGRMILSTYLNENDPCNRYFSNYPGAVLIRDGSLRGSAEKDLQLIQNMLIQAKTFSFDSRKLTEMFYLNTPLAYQNAIENIEQEV